MAVGLKSFSSLRPIAGVRLGTASAGIRKAAAPDLMLMELVAGTRCAAVFTRNAFCAAPVTLARDHLSTGSPRYLLVNAGNANAGTGAAGLEAAAVCCRAVADHGHCEEQQVLPFSTGVIGEPLPVDRIQASLPAAFDALSEAGWEAAAQAIMTTDTLPKGVSHSVSTADGVLTVTGIAKGAGMIRPDMATMLAFLATDAAVDNELLRACLVDAVDQSFNCITVDGDTSTNDACVLAATGCGPVRVTGSGPGLQALREAVNHVCRALAQSIVRDGEGATKFVTVQVDGGRDVQECRQVAYAIAHSPLVKTALFAGDPNWGRILAAVGRAGLDDLDVARVTIHLDEVEIVRDGGRAPEYTEADGQRVMQRDEIRIDVELGRGAASATVWTTDLSYDYVKINAEYRT